MTGKQLLLIAGLSALGVVGCGGSGSSSLKLGAATSLSREGSSGSSTAKAFKYKTAVITVRQAGPNDLKGETVLGGAPKNDVAFYVTQRVTGVQADYSGWLPEPPDITDLHECVEEKPSSGFGPGKSFETCDVYLLPPGDHVGKAVLAAEGPGQADVTWKVS
jgi:hypothetical protein